MRLSMILAATALAACTAQQPNAANEQLSAVEPVSNDVVSVPVEPEPAASPVNMTEEPNQCGADEHQWLVGEKRSRIPEKPQGATWRITCTGCPVTQDYSPERMNIFFNDETEIVDSVTCG